MKRTILALAMCAALCGISYALQIQTVSVTDELGASRTTYSNSEKINLNATIFNDAVIDRIAFKFVIYNPSGEVVFTHTGNSIPGTLGEGGSSVKFIPIDNLRGSGGILASGIYKLTVTANAVSKDATFSVFSPNITPTYPSNYARDLTDKPLIFRWVASGAAKFKITVAYDAAFFNNVITDYSMVTQYSYPDNPSDVRQKLAAGTVYYWKVEGMDAAGNIVAKMVTPYNFTIKSTAITVEAKDVAILDVVADPSSPKVTVSVKNQGGKTETSIPLTLYLNGMMIGSQNIDSISAGETKVYSFLTTLTGQVVAMASITFDDDSPKNNTLTKQITVAAVGASTEKAKILGSVTDSDGNKLPGAIVSYDGQSNGTVYANEGGEYKIENLAAGDYKVKASSNGYTDSDQQTVSIDKMQSYTGIDFKLKKLTPAEVKAAAAAAGIIKGQMTDEDKNGVEGIEVVLMSKDKNGNLSEYKKLTTDKQGYYKFADVPEGSYTISVKADAYEDVAIDVDLKAEATEIKDIKVSARKEKIDYTKDNKKLWEKLGGIIKDDKISAELDGYDITGCDTKVDLNQVMSELQSGKAKITGIEISGE